MSTFLLKKAFHTDLCQNLIDDIQFKRSNYFYFLGRVAEWNNTNTVPTVIDDSLAIDTVTRSEMVSFKKIQSDDVSCVVRRINWGSGGIYDHYDSTVALSGLNFYVLTDEFNVYKCINNNGGVQSTVKPTGTLTTMFTTADGYIWKYMYTIPIVKRNKFLTETKMPVQRALTDRFYSNGAIANVQIVSGGTGYTGTVTIDISGDGSGLVLTPVMSDGVLTGVTIDNPGVGYTYAILNVLTTGTYVTKASIVAVFSESDLVSDQSSVEGNTINGGIHMIKPINIGSDYPNDTTVTIIGDGQYASVTPVIVSGSIVSYTIDDPGTGYTYANVTISTGNIDINPAASVASCYAIISPLGGHGYDAVSELGADTVCLFSNIRYGTQINTVNQDFREYGIIKNIRDVYTKYLVTKSFGLFAYDVVLNSNTGMVKDEVLFLDNKTFRVAEINTGNRAILVPLTQNILASGDMLTAQTNETRQYTINSITLVPDGDKYSGQVLFISDSDAFSFTDEQEITLKTFLTL